MSLRTAAMLGLGHLYHYQPFNVDYLHEVIVDGVIHFSKPSDFNDPWDCRPWFDFESLNDPKILEQHVQWYMEISRKHRPDLPAHVVKNIADGYRRNPIALAAKIREFSLAMATAIDAQYRVYCLSPKCDCELMWSHYAAKHQGVCLEFTVRNELFCTALPVRYAATYPRFSMTGFAGAEEHMAPLLTKSGAWSYEQEFRLISDEAGDPRHTIVTVGGKKAIPPMSLSAVILGCLAPSSTKQAIERMISSSSQKPILKRAVRMMDKYQLEIERA
jgi:hypothetical protein